MPKTPAPKAPAPKTPAPKTPVPKARRRRRRAAERRGRFAELAALVLLTLKGYRVMGRRVRTPFGEIDVIVRRGRVLAFVEVKARDELAEAAEAVSPRQRQRIARAAAWWLARRPAFGNHLMRFDAVLVAPRRLSRHLAGVFEA